VLAVLLQRFALASRLRNNSSSGLRERASNTAVYEGQDKEKSHA
jgi:hypothetical protein